MSSGVNILVGPNASGKTNLLEALLVVSRGKSYRGSDNELINFGKNEARVEAHTPNGTRIVRLKQGEPTLKSFEINSQPLKRLLRSKVIPVVLFEPNHLQGLIGSPESRRNFIDDLLEETITGFNVLRSQYRRTLAQRNALLKTNKIISPNQLFPWDIKLSMLGGQIVQNRLKLINLINVKLTKIYQHISNTKISAKLEYKSSCPTENYESALLNRLQTKTNLDHIRGFTSEGPHRDDINIYLNRRLLIGVASRGEVRSLLLALKVIEAQLIEDSLNSKPLMLLDDVFSELDGARRYSLTDFLKNYQTFITTTDADVVVQHFTQNSHIIPLG